MSMQILLISLVFILFSFYGGISLFGFLYGKRLWYQKDKNYLPKVSLVIATFNEEKIINEKIQNLIQLDYPKEKLEIVFVDASTDATWEMIEAFKENSSLKIIALKETERKGLASALNAGYSAATGEIVVKTDCDILTDKNAIRELVGHFFTPAIGAVSGAIRVSNPSDIEVGYRSIFQKMRIAESNLDSTYMFNTFFAFRKCLIEPIDEKSVADDAELALKIRKKGFKTIYTPTAIAYEASPTSIKDRIKQKSRRAQGHIRLIYQNLGIMFNPKYGKLGLFIFPANFFMIILSPWLFALTLLLGLIYTYSSFGLIPLLLALTLIALTSIGYVKATPKIVAGFLDAQLALLVGFLTLIAKGPDFKWTKEKRSKTTHTHDRQEISKPQLGAE